MASQKDLIRLFVYGTLKRSCSHPMARYLEGRGIYAGPARMRGRLYDLGRFPGLVEALGPEEWVQGDVYILEVDASETLAALDKYEDAAYERILVPVNIDSGEVTEAWTYFYRGKVDEERWIVAGVWTEMPVLP